MATTTTMPKTVRELAEMAEAQGMTASEYLATLDIDAWRAEVVN
jgi:hypothetical protein